MESERVINVRTRLASSGVLIPPAFWRSLSESEVNALFAGAKLNRGQCIRLWEMLGREDRPPESAEIEVNFADIERMIAAHYGR